MQDDALTKYEMPYGDTFLPAIRMRPDDENIKGTAVLHGGFDSFMEEFYSMMRYFSDQGYEVIAFDGPGQGTARKKYGLAFDYEWDKSAKAILDYFKLCDVTWFGISMGGWLAVEKNEEKPEVFMVRQQSDAYDP